MYHSVVHYVHKHTVADRRPWLVLGKGPSAMHLPKVDLDQYHVMTLNHACGLVNATVAHFVDLDAFYDCADHMRGMACLPWYPHVDNKAGKKNLDDLGLAPDAVLTYNSTTASGRTKCPTVHTVRLRFFSAVAAFNIIGMAGMTEIFSLGVDGGTGYAPQFDQKDRLKNGRKTFDDQAGELDLAVKTYHMRWTPLHRHEGVGDGEFREGVSGRG